MPSAGHIADPHFSLGAYGERPPQGSGLSCPHRPGPLLHACGAQTQGPPAERTLPAFSLQRVFNRSRWNTSPADPGVGLENGYLALADERCMFTSLLCTTLTIVLASLS